MYKPSFISWIFSLPLLDEKELYLWSRRVDPKDSEMVIAELVQVILFNNLKHTQITHFFFEFFLNFVFQGENEFLERIAELERELELAKDKIAFLEQKLVCFCYSCRDCDFYVILLLLLLFHYH